MDTCLRPPSPLLPPFSIRDLNGPESSTATIRITGGQYNSTITSQPDACLRYVDETDGEIITVGSSFELRQRLDEPVSEPSHTPDRFYSPSTRFHQGQLMHIFDITKSSGSLAVWRDHEAYSSKMLREPLSLDTGHASLSAVASPNEPPKPHSTAVSPLQHTTSSQSRFGALKEEAAAATEDLPKTHGDVLSDVGLSEVDLAFNGLLNTLQAQLGPLADILEATANGLRKAAEKTAEADTTAVENVMKGFKSIFTELGTMGRDFLTTLDEEFEKTQRTGSKSPVPNDHPTVESNSGAISTAVPSNVDSAWKRVSFVEPPKKATVTKPIPLPTTTISYEKPMSTPLQVRLGVHAQNEKPDLEGHSSRATNQTEVKTQSPSISAVGVPSPGSIRPQPKSQTTDSRGSKYDSPAFSRNSILDWETTDPDFSIRYPPLMSIRKTKSIGAIHDQAAITNAQGSMLPTTSALTRYPSIPQFEEQNRRSVNVLPSSPKKPGPLVSHLLKASMNGAKPKTSRDDSSQRGTDSSKIDLPVSSPTEGKRHDERPLPETTTKPNWPLRNLPGSWPDAKSDDWFAPAPLSDAKASSTSEGYSGHFSARVSSPGAESYYRAPIFPRRHQTVSSTNPAARLNGPFDPLASLPLIQPRPQKSQPNLKVAPVQSNPPQRPTVDKPVWLPQRGHTVHLTDRYRPQPRFNPSDTTRPSWFERPANPELSRAKSFDRRFSFERDESTASVSEANNIVTRDSISTDVSNARVIGCTSCERNRMKCDGARPSCDRCTKRDTDCTYLDDSEPEEKRSVQGQATVETSAPPRAVPATVIFPPYNRTAVPQAQDHTFDAPTYQRYHPRDFPIRSALAPPASSHIATVPTTRPRYPDLHFPPRGSPPTAITAVDSCIQSLKSMGYGTADPNELARLAIYAGAAAGNVEEAIEMIEEDREAARQYADYEDLEDTKDSAHDSHTEGEIRL